MSLNNLNATLIKIIRNNTLKKWGPAIILAIAVHILIITLFIINNHNNKTIEAERQQAAKDTTVEPVVLPEVLLTLTESDLQAEKEAADMVLSQDDEDDKNEEKAKDNTIENISSTVTNPEPITHTANTHSVPPPVISSAPPQPVPNPNDQVLLPRDMPAALGTQALSEEAMSAQQLSDELSDAINAIKEEKLRQIAAEQRQSTASFVKNYTLEQSPTPAVAAQPESQDQ